MNARTNLVNNQFNSPMKLYSPENVADTLNKQTQILANGALGIDFHQMAAPGNLANSAVLRMLEEEAKNGGKENIPIDYSKPKRRLLRFEWPPKENATIFDENNDANNCSKADANNNETSKTTLGRRDPDDAWCTKRSRHHFPTTTGHLAFAGPGVKCVSWPPPPEHKVKNVIEKQLVYPQESAQPAAFNPAAPQPLTESKQSQQTPPIVAPWSPNAAPWSPSSVNAPVQPAAPVYQRIVQAPAPVYEPPPTFVTLRQQAPVSQAEAPVFPSQPAATHTRALPPTRTPRGTMMRGDQKWPPAEQKAQAVAENEARQALAKGPAMRPRAVKKDYSQFFAQNAITTTYPGYRAPPGTQHYAEDGTSNF